MTTGCEVRWSTDTVGESDVLRSHTLTPALSRREREG
jgi:hypothetical protein